VAPCKATEYESHPATKTANVRCATSENCGTDEWESKPHAPGKTERECSSVTKCVAGQYVKAAATPNSDTQCAACRAYFWTVSDAAADELEDAKDELKDAQAARAQASSTDGGGDSSDSGGSGGSTNTTVVVVVAVALVLVVAVVAVAKNTVKKNNGLRWVVAMTLLVGLMRRRRTKTCNEDA